MTRHLVCLLALGLGGLSAVAADATAQTSTIDAVPATPADAAWAAVSAVLDETIENGVPWGEMTPAQRRDAIRRFDAKQQALEAAITEFAARFPNDPRRLEVFVGLSYQPPQYIVSFSCADDVVPGWDDIVGDEARKAEFRERQKARIDEVLASPDATERQVGGAFYSRYVEARSAFLRERTPEHLQAFLAVAEAMMDRLPDSAGRLLREHLGFLEQHGSEADRAAYLARLESSDDPEVRRILAESRGDFSRFDGLAELAFTAADGREVDLARLRGKVVLVDFWATWCTPCIAEIPNLVANYEKYHDKGFEVIGITLENSGVKRDFESEAAAPKLLAAKNRMLAFARKHAMPWPQYFDGKFWENDYARRFGIQAIPAMVLLGPDGKVVSIDARGEELERQIRRLLQL
jgi:thiol-disulfide isomerase/thioredoxin